MCWTLCLRRSLASSVSLLCDTPPAPLLVIVCCCCCSAVACEVEIVFPTSSPHLLSCCWVCVVGCCTPISDGVCRSGSSKTRMSSTLWSPSLTCWKIASSSFGRTSGESNQVREVVLGIQRGTGDAHAPPGRSEGLGAPCTLTMMGFPRHRGLSRHGRRYGPVPFIPHLVPWCQTPAQPQPKLQHRQQLPTAADIACWVPETHA